MEERSQVYSENGREKSRVLWKWKREVKDTVNMKMYLSDILWSYGLYLYSVSSTTSLLCIFEYWRKCKSRFWDSACYSIFLSTETTKYHSNQMLMIVVKEEEKTHWLVALYNACVVAMIVSGFGLWLFLWENGKVLARLSAISAWVQRS